MVASFIALNYQSGTPQMVRYAGTNTAFVGTSFGSLDVSPAALADSNAVQSIGRIIRFGGLNTYLAATGNSIYRTTNGGTTWLSVLTLPSIGSNNCAKSGFTVIYLNGVPNVCLLYESTSTTARAVFSPDGINWTSQGPFTVLSTSGGADSFNCMLVVGSTLYAQNTGSGTNPRTVIYTPGANQAVSAILSGEANGATSAALCEFNNRIFALYVRTSGTSLSIGEIVGTSTSIITTLDSGLPSTTDGQGSLFVDGSNMYAITIGSGGGFKAWKIDSTLATTEITSTVLPTALTSTQPSGSARVLPLIDGVTSPGSSPTIYLMFASTSNNIWALYQWNGDATQISMVSQGGSTRHSLPFFRNVTGTYFVADSVFPSTVGISAEITDRNFTASGVRLYFKIYGTSAGGAISFRIYTGGTDAEYPTVAGTLTDPSVGVISGGNINTGLTADNGATIYQVTWAAQTDGFTANEQFRLIGDVFTT